MVSLGTIRHPAFYQTLTPRGLPALQEPLLPPGSSLPSPADPRTHFQGTPRLLSLADASIFTLGIYLPAFLPQFWVDSRHPLPSPHQLWGLGHTPSSLSHWPLTYEMEDPHACLKGYWVG